jgi:hypothetical protein
MNARNYHGDRPLAPFFFYWRVAGNQPPRLTLWRKFLRRRRFAAKLFFPHRDSD